jgi:hypothetical protein
MGREFYIRFRKSLLAPQTAVLSAPTAEAIALTPYQRQLFKVALCLENGSLNNPYGQLNSRPPEMLIA